MHESDTLDEIKVAVEEPRSWAKRLTITVPAARVERERLAVARDLARRIRLPGFRTGKVPPSVVERRYAPAIEQEAVQRTVENVYQEVLEEHQFRPITQGSVDTIDYAPGKDLTFQVDFEVQPVIELTRIGGFKVTRQQPEVSEEAVEEVLDRLRRDHARWRTLDEDATPQAEDGVHIEITPLTGDDGAPGEPRAYRIVLGHGHAVPDIEDAIRTLRPGQEAEFDVRVAGEDGTVAEGEDAPRQRVRIRLLEAQRPEFPELNDDFARSVGDFDDLAALRAAIREDLERDASAEADRKLRYDLIDMIVDANPFDVPQSMIDRYVDGLLSGGADDEQRAELRAVAAPAAERAIKRTLVIERIAEMHGLRATQEDVDQRVEAIAERQGRSPSEVWAQLQRSGRLATLEEEITEEKVFEFLLAQSTVE